MDFDWAKRTSQPVLDLPFVEGVPSAEKAKIMNRWLRDNKDLYANKLVKLYHGTDPSLPIESEGLKPTSLRRRRSYQSQSGYVYLANTPQRAENFGKLGNQGRCAVYEVVVPVRSLCADLDQLANQRSTGRHGDLGNTIGESIIYGGGARIKGAIQPWQVRKMAPEELATMPDRWPTKEELLKLWLDNAPTHRSGYGLYGHPPMWETLKIGSLTLFTRAGKTMDRPAPFMPYVEVDGVHYEWMRDGYWVGQGCQSTFEWFEERGPSMVDLDVRSREPAVKMDPMSADEFWDGKPAQKQSKPPAAGPGM